MRTCGLLVHHPLAISVLNNVTEISIISSVQSFFIGSCTNGRIEDMRSAAGVIVASTNNGGPSQVADGVEAMVVPGSKLVKTQAEAEGLDLNFKKAGFDWREAGCSMCLGMNPDSLKPQERCASTSNRYFEGRQGVGVRTHLMSPAMVSAAALTGHLTDVRKLIGVHVNDDGGIKITSYFDYLTPITLASSLPPSPTDEEPTPVQAAVVASAGLPKFTIVKGIAAPSPKQTSTRTRSSPKNSSKHSFVPDLERLYSSPSDLMPVRVRRYRTSF